MTGRSPPFRSVWVREPDDADPRPFDCWVCGKLMFQIPRSKTRMCADCDVLELRHIDEYIPRVRIEKHLTSRFWGDITYLDHGAGHYPSPA